MKLSHYVDSLEARGQYWFVKNQALKDLKCTPVALGEAIKKLNRKKRLLPIRAGFIIILPLAYQEKGAIPPDWFIEPLMMFLDTPYYISLLTAAHFYGAAHHKPQIFQVMIGHDLREVSKGPLKIQFYQNGRANRDWTKKVQVYTGYARIAIPELVAIELVQYYKAAGHLSNIAIVLSELQEQLDPNKLFEIASSNNIEMAVLQRFGYLMCLNEIGGAQKVERIKQWLQVKKPRWVNLQPEGINKVYAKEHEWRLWVNQKVEMDE